MAGNGKLKVVAVQQGHKASRTAQSLAHDAVRAMAFRHKSASRLFRIPSTLTQQTSKRALIQEFDRSNKMTWSRALTMTHRLIIFAAAVIFLQVCISACIDIFHELDADQGAYMDISPTESLLMGKWVGTTTIRTSPLVTDLLGNDTSLRTGTLYLDTNSTSFSGCTSVELSNEIYLDNFQRQMFSTFARDAAYSLTYFDSRVTELILPVVDCSFGSLYWSDNTTVRFFFLVRLLSDINSVFLVIVSMGMQDTQTVGQVDQGPAAVATVAAITNLTATSIDHNFMIAEGYPYKTASFEVYKYLSVTSDSLWELQRVPSISSAVATIVTTAYRLGVYIREETDQASYKNLIWVLPQDPLDFINYWRWIGRPVLRNSWAWLHVIHFYLATDLVLKLFLLCLASAVHIKRGRVWVADAFSSISTTLAWLAPVVILSWALERGWTLLELAIYDGNMISETQSVYIRMSIARADMMVLCFSIAAQVGNVFKARVDPAVTALAFYVSFEHRRSIIQWFPSLKQYITTYTDDDYNLGKDASENVQLISPLARWSTHEISSYPVAFVFASIGLVVGFFLLIIVVYTIIHKVYRFYFPVQLQVKRMTGRSVNAEELLVQKRTLTIFELATGAELLDRYGLLSDYSNYIFIKGTKFATTDGIYASGFAIANDRFVLKAHDLRTICLMKLTGIRFADVYVYDVSERVVSHTARLVHPGTLSFQDLTQITISKLA